jgi:hypothetical protein
MKTQTREEWLVAATNMLRKDFSAIDAEIPEKVHVTCGWPSKGGRPGVKQRIGECWKPECSEGGYTEMFINPMLGEGLEALDVLVHELVHATLGCEGGHKGPFRTTALAIGLEGKMTATVAGKTLLVRLHEIIAELGDYPHDKLTPINKKPQSTRMLKLECPNCQWMARTSRKWMDLGLPTCACGTKMEEV